MVWPAVFVREGEYAPVRRHVLRTDWEPADG
jgi:hypothetical protein